MFSILFLVSLYLVIKAIAKIWSQRKCPTDYDLRRAVLHQKSGKYFDRDRIIAHLGLCQECRDKVNEMVQSK